MKKTSRAGVSDTRAGLQPAGLFSNAGIFKKGFQDFHPLDESPYLLFDAESSMLGNLENPSLDLDASKAETLDVITATRAGIATFTAADGQIVTADENTVRVDHVQGEELTPTKFQRIGYTDFDNANLWTKNEATLESGQLSPIGDNTAIKLTATGSDPYVYALINTSAQTHTFSFYCKGEGPTIGETARVLLWYIGGATGTTESIDFTYTGEWQRFEFQTTPTGAGTLAYRIDVPANTSTAGHVAYLWGPQLEEGTTATDFVPNTTGSPKFIASATYADRVPMMLIEPSATNLVPYSEDFSDTFYIKDSGVSIGTTNHQSPSGSLNATKIEVSDNGRLYANTTSDTYAASIFIKKGTFANFIVSGNYIDLNAGTATSGTIEQLNDGWYRVSSSKVTTSRPFQIQAYPDATYSVHSESGDFYIWGAQVETGSVATSYIPTSGSAVTRNADNLVIDGTNFSDFYNATEGTIYCEFVYDFDPAYEYIYNIRQSPSDEIRSQITSSNEVRTRYVVASAYISSVVPSGGIKGSLNRHGYSYKTDNFKGSLNGSVEAEDLSGTASLSPTWIQLGGRGNGISNIKLKRFIYWPTSSDSL